MKHYPHHIRDFDSATRHLNRIERSIYRDMIELYYDTEKQLPLDLAWICRRVLAHSNEESTAVEQALNEFFTKTPTGWYHERCEEELEAYRNNTSQRAMAGKASAEAKRLKKLQALNGDSTDVDLPLPTVATNGNGVSTNQSTNQPINQSTITEGKPSVGRATRKCPDSFVVTDELTEWAESASPLVNIDLETAKLRDHTFKNAISDWPGAWRNWMRKSQQDADARRSRSNQSPSTAQKSFAQQDREAGWARWEEMTNEVHPDRIKAQQQSLDQRSVIDITPRTLELTQ